jgi:hypothetical protein
LPGSLVGCLLSFWQENFEVSVMSCNLAIAGVTGAVGQEFLSIIAERDFPFNSLKMLASSRSAGKKIEFKGKTYVVEELTENSFSRVDIALFSAGGGNRAEQGDHCLSELFDDYRDRSRLAPAPGQSRQENGG